MSVVMPVGRACSAEGWHERLVGLVRGRSRARVELGRLVDELARRSGHHELGFSSTRAYALQRTGLSPRFVQESRSMARRLFGEVPGAPGLPRLCEALCRGEVSWSAAARVAPALARCASKGGARFEARREEAERAAVEAATSLTIRRLEPWLVERERVWTGREGEVAGADEREPTRELDAESEAPERHLLQRAVSGLDRELIEATRQLITLIDGPVSDEQFVEALLAEAHGAMAGAGDGMAQALGREARRHDWAAAHGDVLEACREARRRGEAAAAEATEARVMRLRERREASRDPGRGAGRAVGPSGSHALGARDPAQTTPWEGLGALSLSELDARIAACGARIAERDLGVADAALAVSAARYWRRLGWRSQDEYAREELGISGSSLKAIVARARQMIALPELRAAVEAGALGLEAAGAIGRVATPDSVDAWVERAGRRTVVHLHEEVRAVQLLARGGEVEGPLATDLGPPTAAQLEAVREFERSVASGAWFDDLLASVGAAGAGPEGASDVDGQMCGPRCGSGEAVEARDGQMGGPPGLDPGHRGAPRRAALVFSGSGAAPDQRLHLRISDEQAGWWRYLERAYARHERGLAQAGGEPMSFVAFACVAVWMSWYPSIRHTGQYDRWTAVYVRDRYRCSSPVCSRRDVTPHHLRFQAHGGGDEAANVAALCSWCHLEGIHGGRISASPPASAIHWRLGRAGGGLEVRGRELV